MVSICILPVWVFVYLYTISVKMDKPIGIYYTVLTKINSINCKYFKNDLKSRLLVFNTKVVVRNMGGEAPIAFVIKWILHSVDLPVLLFRTVGKGSNVISSVSSRKGWFLCTPALYPSWDLNIVHRILHVLQPCTHPGT